jgi:nucleotide-binding universal stress UspA family protein
LVVVLACEARDCDVIVTGYSDARIPWPVGRRPGRGPRGLVLFGDLARAVRRESAQAVEYWFGVGPWKVWHWRKALGVGPTNDGTHRLRSDWQQEPWAKRARRKAVAKAADPDRRRKIAEARLGKPRPRHVIEAMAEGRVRAAKRRRQVG